MAVAKFLSKDQHWQDEKTVYWFDLDGQTVGISESGPDSTPVDSEGYPIDTNEWRARSVTEACIVTDEMRAD
jgi:hypothetical protein